MSIARRPCVIGGSALIASSLVAVTPAASPPDPTRVVSADVRLVDASDASSVLLGDGLGSLSGLFSDGGLFGDGSLLNIPYNIFADIVNIPYTESLALQEYAYALGPAGSVGGVPGWIPPGTPDAGVAVIDGQEYYASGGTGSWWMESIGNTWGWDNGNWPQVDALLHFVLPLQWTEGLAASIQSVGQSAFIDGAESANCEFECSSLVGYLGGWLTHLPNVFLSTYPVTTTDTIPADGAASPTFPDGVINVGPAGFEDTAIWSGQPVELDGQPFNPLLETFQAIWQNAVESPLNNPIILPNIGDVFTNAAKLGQDLINDFDPFIQGSFVYWGADTLYSIPSLINGLGHDLSLGLIPNEFVLANNGAEPLSGYTAGPESLPQGLLNGLQFLLTGADGDHGLLGFLDPSTWGPQGAIAAADASAAAAATTDFGNLLGSLGDPSGLLADLSSLVPNLTAELASMAPQLSADLGSWAPDLAASLIP